MGIAALILWACTAGFGLYLLRAVTAAKRAAHAPLPDMRVVSVGKVDGQQFTAPRRVVVTARVGAQAGPHPAEPAWPVGAAEQAVPHITHTRVTLGPDDHPLLEFCHPALGFVGLGLWLAYTFIHYPLFGWLAFGVLVVTVTAGLTWFTANARARRAETGAATDGATRADQPQVPRHLVVLHGAVATVTLALAATSVLVLARP